MNALDLLKPTFDWVLHATWSASILIGLVLLLQWLLREKLAPRWRYALWLLVVLRLALPVSLGSAVSLFNFAKVEATKSIPAERPAPTAVQSAATPGSEPTADAPANFRRPLWFMNATDEETELQLHLAGSARTIRTPEVIYWIGLTGWAAVASFLLLQWIWQNACFLRRMRARWKVGQSEVLQLFEECQALTGVRRKIELLSVEEITSPALYGVFRLRLLLPKDFLANFNREELRHIFLHELAHVKRWDTAVNGVATVLQMLHWFNPLVRLAFRRMALDRELACDEMALNCLKQGDNQAYGATIIKLLENAPQRLPSFTTVGVLEDYRQLLTRMHGIARFGRPQTGPIMAIGLLVLLAAVGLTDAQIGGGAKGRSDAVVLGNSARTMYFEPGNETGSQLSPDESKIAYLEGDDWSGNVVVQDLKTRQNWKITHAETNRSGVFSFKLANASALMNAIAVVWSPDSKRIAFCWNGDTNETGIRIASADGSENKLLRAGREMQREMNVWKRGGMGMVYFGDETRYFYPADWSKDGRFLLCILFRYEKGKGSVQDLVRISVDSGELKPIATGLHVIGWIHAQAVHPRFSPDGQFAVFHQTLDENRDVYCARIDDGKVERLTDSPLLDSKPVWSQDGKLVIFSRGRHEGAPWELWAVRVRDGKPVGDPFPLGVSTFGDFYKRISVQGNLICTGQRTERVDSLVSVDPQTGKTDPARPVLADSGPFGVRGNRFYYRRKTTLFAGSIDGREESYSVPLAEAGGPQINGDGKWLAFSGRDSQGKAGVFAFHTERGALEPLSFSEEYSVFTDGAAPPENAKEVLLQGKDGYAAIDLVSKKLRKLNSPQKPLFGGGTTQPRNGHHPFPALLKTMYVEEDREKKEDQLTVFDLNTGAKQVVVRAVWPEKILKPNWRWRQPGETTQMTYVRVGKDKRKELHLVSIDGSTDRILPTGDWNLDLFKRPNISFDGSMMAVGYGAEYDVTEYLLLSLDGKWHSKLPLSGATWDSGWWFADNRTLLVPSKRVRWEISIIENYLAASGRGQ